MSRRLPRGQRGSRHRQHRLADRRVDRRPARLRELERRVAGATSTGLEAGAVLAEQRAELGGVARLACPVQGGEVAPEE